MRIQISKCSELYLQLYSADITHTSVNKICTRVKKNQQIYALKT